MSNFGDMTPKKEGEPWVLDMADMNVSIGKKDHTYNELDSKLNAYKDLMKCLDEDEIIEAIVFGEWGWGDYREPVEKPVPKDKQGVILTIKEAKPMMAGWTYFCGYGSPECYATNVWTNKRILWITQYDGSTSIDSAPRNPTAVIPEMPGG